MMQENMARNCTNGGICSKARDLQTTQETDDAIQIVNRGLFWEFDKQYPVVGLQVVPGE